MGGDRKDTFDFFYEEKKQAESLKNILHHTKKFLSNIEMRVSTVIKLVGNIVMETVFILVGNK